MKQTAWLTMWLGVVACAPMPAYGFPDSAPEADPSAMVIPAPPDREGVEWRGLSNSSLRFLGIMHAFRWATETGTREGGITVGRGYLNAVRNMHGWSDGDPFYVNYVGHPMQGSVAARLFNMNDPRFNKAEFGRDPVYWKGRLRGAAYSWAFSAQFEIGPVSEASIGRIQSRYPQQGFVDHVVTPAFGLGWTIAEDALDRYAVVPIEGLTRNRWARMMARSWLNPARSFANVLNGRPPWHRDNRSGILAFDAASQRNARPQPAISGPEYPESAPLEFTVTSGWRSLPGARCAGGGAEAAYRVAPAWQLALDVSGCKLLGLDDDWTGDALLYRAGVRWSPGAQGRWSPYARLMAGGLKVTRERIDGARKQQLDEAAKGATGATKVPLYKRHEQYAVRDEANGLAVSAGAGVQYKFNPALALRVAGIEYMRSTVRGPWSPYSRGLEVSTGMVLRLGTW